MDSKQRIHTVLIIDDDEAIRVAFRVALADLPYRVIEADDGAEGAEIAVQEDVDLVYLDLRMPKLDGVATLRRIRAAKPDLPVYIVTAFDREYFDELMDVRNDGLRFELLRKPLSRRQLIELTKALLPPT